MTWFINAYMLYFALITYAGKEPKIITERIIYLQVDLCDSKFHLEVNPSFANMAW